jgi:ATP-binding cassette, subfamily B, bacterial CvaB/MchF/RaxB
VMSIEVKNLRFRYSTSDPWILKDVSLKISTGETVAIVGPSGGGKSTIFKILVGIIHPEGGQVLISGLPFEELGAESVRRMIGTVLQDDSLFAGTVEENITFFAADPDLDFAHRCAKIANIYEDIMRMPLAFNTLIGDMGSILSAGQQQRVLLARAVYKRPKMLLLDEATSNLDLDSERYIANSLAALPMGRLVIAHRPQTIISADRVYALRDGKLLEVSKSEYTKLC